MENRSNVNKGVDIDWCFLLTFKNFLDVNRDVKAAIRIDKIYFNSAVERLHSNS